MAKSFGEMEVADQTVSTRVQDIDLQLEKILKDKIANYAYWSAALDESTNNCGMSTIYFY